VRAAGPTDIGFGPPALVLPVDARRWVLADNNILVLSLIKTPSTPSIYTCLNMKIHARETEVTIFLERKLLYFNPLRTMFHIAREIEVYSLHISIIIVIGFLI
jgi:hypothetical protein